MEDAPAVALWLARHLGIVPAAGLVGLEDWWTRWAASTRPAFTPAMLLAGRALDEGAIAQWCADGQKLELQGDSVDETIAFLAAAGLNSTEPWHDDLLARCVVAETTEAFDIAAAWTVPAAIAASADVARSAGVAMAKGHRVFLAVGRTLSSRGPGPRKLSRVDRHALELALTNADLPREDAVAIISGCGGSLTVMHRRQSAVDAVRRPSWAARDRTVSLVGPLLAGAWSEEIRPTNLGSFAPTLPPLLDRQVLCTLAGKTDYDLVAGPVRQYQAADDAPFRHAARVWRLTAALDAWYLLSEQLQAADLIRLADAALAVLGVPHPKYELPDEDQWLAASRGKARSHSGWLREGLSISLAIVAQRGDELQLPIPGGTAENFIGAVIRKITNVAQGWRGWASLDDVLPIIAEAAPTTFLDAVEDLVRNRPDDVQELLTDGGGNGMTGECRHAGLLWALERIAWHPAYLTRTILILSRLDQVDPGGRWSNRPFSTLCEILLGPGDPYTFAGPEGCIAAIDALIELRPTTAWGLLMRAANPMHSRMVRDPPAHLGARPDGWGPWTIEQRSLFWGTLSTRLTGMIEIADDAGIIDALKQISFLPHEGQRALCTRLERRRSIAVGDANDPMWNAVRGAIHRLRSFGGAANVAEGIEDALERFESALAPAAPSVVAQWLFGGGAIQLLDGETQDWQAYHERIRVSRRNVVRQLLNDVGPVELLAFSQCLPDLSSFGMALAAEATDNEDAELMLPLLSSAQPEAAFPPKLSVAYAACRSGDAAWRERWLGEAKKFEDGAACAALCCAFPFGTLTWQLVSTLQGQVQRLYWTWVNGLPPAETMQSDLEYAAEQLLAVGRADTVLDWVTLRSLGTLSGTLLAQLARDLIPHLNAPDAQVAGGLPWRIEQLFKHLDAAGVADDEIARLEWAYLPLLLPLHAKRGPRKLCGLLANDPTVFVQMICWIWNASSDEGDQEDDDSDDYQATDEAKKIRFRNAYDLLRSWHGPLPGQLDLDIDTEVLRRWIGEARRLCHEAGRGRVGDSKLGQMLVFGPNDPHDGAWPHRAVRQVIDEIRNDEVDDGFTVGVINARGVTTRGMHDGGDQERVLADRYAGWASSVRASWPHTARLLDRLSEQYRGHAKDEDERAELNRLR